MLTMKPMFESQDIQFMQLMNAIAIKCTTRNGFYAPFINLPLI